MRSPRRSGAGTAVVVTVVWHAAAVGLLAAIPLFAGLRLVGGGGGAGAPIQLDVVAEQRPEVAIEAAHWASPSSPPSSAAVPVPVDRGVVPLPVVDPVVVEVTPDLPAELVGEEFGVAWPIPRVEEAERAAPAESVAASRPPAKASRPRESGAVAERRAVELTGAVLTRSTRPSYPRVAREREHEGTVHVRATVSAAGKVVATRVSRSSGHSSLDGAALRAVSKWRFRPATRGGRPIDSAVVVPVKFALR